VQIDRVDTYQRLGLGVVDHEDSHVGREPGGEGVTSDGRSRVHRRHYLDLVVQLHELQVLVVEPLVRDQLLQKGRQLNRVVLIRLRQIYVFQIDYESAAVFGLVHPSELVRGLQTNLP